jgi:hypothetical protein
VCNVLFASKTGTDGTCMIFFRKKRVRPVCPRNS